MIKTIGIIGGGQLGKMISHSAQELGFKTLIFSDVANSCAVLTSNQSIIASYEDESALEKFASAVDVATFEFENIPLSTIDYLANKTKIFPNPNILKIAQNRLLEKNFLNSQNIDTVRYYEINNLKQLQDGLANFNGNGILKTSMMGYDGKGQIKIENHINAEEAFKILGNAEKIPLILEEFCHFDGEISIIIARNKSEIASFAPLKNIHKNGILAKSIFPCGYSQNIINSAEIIAKKIATKLDLIGVLAVEFFVVGEELLVNEIAPRPHNSGHFSMDGASISQFEQLVRAITGLKLGSPQFYFEGFMQNLIGDEVNKIDEYYNTNNARIYLYGKGDAKDGRKMGHINFLTNNTISHL